MAARGTEAKKEITEKILETFSGSFLYDNGKEIRIPMVENGENIQIKVNLVCAKTNVDNGGDTIIPGAKVGSISVDNGSAAPATPTFMNEPTEEEKAKVSQLLDALGLATV